MLENNKKITVLYLIDFLVSNDGLSGGTERQLLEIIKRLDRKRFNVCLFCLREDPDSSIFKMIECEKHNLKIYSFKSVHGFISLFNLMKYFKKNDVDVFQAFFFDSIFLGVIAAKLARVEHVISCRRDMGFWYSKSLLKKLSFLNRLTDKILVNSVAIQLNVANKENVSREKIDVIYNGIDLQLIDTAPACDLCMEFKNIKADDRIVGMVANFNRQVKRVDVFIRALAEVLKQERHVKFLVVGEGGLKDSFVELTKELKVDGALIWAGKKENPIPYVKGFTIGVQSSDSEGFSNSILEYMAAGLPVVATRVGGNPELIKDGKNGFLVPAGDHHALADRILQLLSDEKLASNMGLEGARLVREKYSWDTKIKEYETYYQRLVGHIT